ncbi:MAG: DUF202 domain-containing protein [Sedimentisphaerales bacterium]|nr:DUF202 domain-containing protein [Sedimentisphaerales bacterium]
MAKNPYERFKDSELILRDELAIDRTLLANERTLLAYLRSAVALLITGVSIIHFGEHKWFVVIGFFCIPFSLLIAILGISRFTKMNKTIAIVRRELKTIAKEKNQDL